jgi:hypothetical protein
MAAQSYTFLPQSSDYDLVYDFLENCIDIPLNRQLYVIDHTEYGALIVGGYLSEQGKFVLHGYSTQLGAFDGQRLFTSYAFYLDDTLMGVQLEENIFPNRTEWKFQGKDIDSDQAQAMAGDITRVLNQPLAFLMHIPLYPYDEQNGVFIGAHEPTHKTQSICHGFLAFQ